MKDQSKRSIIEKMKTYFGCAPQLINTTNKRYPCTTTNIEKKFMFSFSQLVKLIGRVQA
jgi:hypothetical protein